MVFSNKAKPHRWAKAQDEALRAAVQQFGAKNWKLIAESIPGRDAAQCMQRWTKSLHPSITKGRWSALDDAILRRLVMSGEKNWGIVAAQISGRTTKQCWSRWSTHLDPSLNHGPFTAEEDKLLIEKYGEYGSAWSKIALHLQGRTNNAVKVRFKSLSRKRQRQQPLNELTAGLMIAHTHAAQKTKHQQPQPAAWGEGQQLQQLLEEDDFATQVEDLLGEMCSPSAVVTAVEASCAVEELRLLVDGEDQTSMDIDTGAGADTGAGVQEMGSDACTSLALAVRVSTTPPPRPAAYVTARGLGLFRLVADAQSHVVHAYTHHYNGRAAAAAASAAGCLQVADRLAAAAAAAPHALLMRGWGMCALALAQSQEADEETWSRHHARMCDIDACAHDDGATDFITGGAGTAAKAEQHARAALAIGRESCHSSSSHARPLPGSARLVGYSHLSLALALLSRGTHAAAREAAQHARGAVELHDADPATGAAGRGEADYRLLAYADCALARALVWEGYRLLKRDRNGGHGGHTPPAGAAAGVAAGVAAAGGEQDDDDDDLRHAALVAFEAAAHHAVRARRLATIGAAFGFVTVPRLGAWLAVMLHACAWGAVACGVADTSATAIAGFALDPRDCDGSTRFAEREGDGFLRQLQLQLRASQQHDDAGKLGGRGAFDALPEDPLVLCAICGKPGTGCPCVLHTMHRQEEQVDEDESKDEVQTQAQLGDEAAAERAISGFGPWGLGARSVATRTSAANRACRAERVSQLEESAPWSSAWVCLHADLATAASSIDIDSGRDAHNDVIAMKRLSSFELDHDLDRLLADTNNGYIESHDSDRLSLLSIIEDVADCSWMT